MAQRKIESWLSEYGESHINPINKKIHYFCVPLIFFSIFGLLRTIPTSEFMATISPYFNWAAIMLVLTLVYYAMLSIPLFLGFIIWALIVFTGVEFIYDKIGNQGLLIFSIIVFVVAWIGQFVGHKIEGKKPSFFKDLSFLLIGPAWILNAIMKVVKY